LFTVLGRRLESFNPCLSKTMTGIEMICLALVVFWESRNQPILGQMAVAQIVVQRRDSPRFPDTICEVAHQGRDDVLHQCAFSFFCDGHPENPNDERAWQTSQDVAEMVYSGARILDLIGVFHYVTIETNPCVTHGWGCDMRVQKVIGDHKFLIDDFA